MARKPAPGVVHVVPRDGLRFDPAEVFAQDVDPETAAALVASGVYVVPDVPAESPAVTADTTEAPDAG